jgi:uncharacterized membrane protein
MTPGRGNPLASKSKNDRLVIGSCCVALATLVPVALYQSGVLPRLPDPPLGVFDSERITTSDAAHPLGIPDGWLGLASFATTLALAILAKRHGAARKLLGAKLTLDGSAAAFNATRQVISFGKLCSWCTGTAMAAGVMAYGGRNAIQETWTEAFSWAKRGWEIEANSQRVGASPPYG